MKESELEAKLSAFAPAKPSSELEERIATGLHASIVPAASQALQAPISGVLTRPKANAWARLFYGLGGALAGAAIAVIAVSYLSPANGAGGRPALKPAAASSSVFEPAESDREVVSTDNVVVYDANNEPTQLVRYSSIERHSWTNAATGARIEVEAPREDMVLVPVSFQ